MSVLFHKAKNPQHAEGIVSLRIAITSLIVIHSFGCLGLLYPPTRSYFELATPVNLLITGALLFYFHKDWNKSFILFSIICFVTGYLVEVAGVQTGLIFGEYTYGPTLGFKLWGVPLIIGLNWLILIYSTGVMAQAFSQNWILKSLIGSGLMILLDFFIEPVAVTLDFWHWEGGEIPVHNFLGWFITALFLQSVFHLLSFEKNNLLAKYVFYVQLVFFIFLQILT